MGTVQLDPLPTSQSEFMLNTIMLSSKYDDKLASVICIHVSAVYCVEALL